MWNKFDANFKLYSIQDNSSIKILITFIYLTRAQNKLIE